MPGSCPPSDRLAAVHDAFRSLPERYLGGERGLDATVHVRLGDVGHTWEVRLREESATVRRGITRRSPDVVVGTDAATWLAMRAGELSGIDAFGRRLLYARGDLDLAVGFEGRFARPGGAPPLLRLHDVRLPGCRISTLTMGEGPDMLLLHGLGSTKASFYDTAATLSDRYRVHAIDFPGFGSSSKSPTAPYSARYFADSVLDVMDDLGIDRAHVVGNSMGGRVAVELGLRRPERVRALGLLCPAVAFVRRSWHPLVRVLRPELGLLPHRYPRRVVASQFWSMFCDPDRVDPSVADVAVDEFQRIYGSAGARYAFLSAARNLYLDAPWGKHGFYSRLADLEAPSLFVWGSHDALIPAAFQRHVREWLPAAEQVVLPDCGHVPQVEHPEACNALLRDFFARAEERLAPAERRLRFARTRLAAA